MTATKRNDPLIGTRLGDYMIQELIGRGGMARVYRGEDKNLGRHAAVKVLDIATSDKEDDRIVERFKLEARAIASFEHPNIITIYQFGESDHLFFIAMKMVQGDTLSRVLRQARRKSETLPPEQVLAITRDVCSALDYAHERGIIHRDIKPSNILFDANANNRAILTDFGLAMELGGDSTMGTAFGTPRYIAPEQAVSSQKAVPQSDLYSLAVVVYEMLTGQVPFQDESPMSIALYHITSEPPPPRSINPDIPEAVELVLLRSLSKEPEQRFQTAGAFYQALEDAYYSSEVDLPTPNVDTDAEAPVDALKGAKAKNLPKAAREELAAKNKKKKAARRRRRRIGCIPAVLLMVAVIGGVFGFWLLNGQSVFLPPGVSEAAWQVVHQVQDTVSNILASAAETPEDEFDSSVIPPDAELTFDLIYDQTYFVLYNRTLYTVPLNGLTLEWNNGSVTYEGTDFESPIPPGQCAWLWQKGSLLPTTLNGQTPEDRCPSLTNAHYVRQLDRSDLFWLDYDLFRVRFHGEELTTCNLEDGRCRFTLPSVPVPPTATTPGNE